MKICYRAILPPGFKASAAAAGIKKSGKLDVALFYSVLPAKAACLFTANAIQAAPVQVSKSHLARNRSFHAIIVNSGNANCFTGQPGRKDAEAMAAYASDGLAVKKEEVLVASTGIIGRRLPVAKIAHAVPKLAAKLSGKGIDNAKVAIMTTDTFAKEVTVTQKIAGKTITVCGVAKGAGMIAPNMATMLSFIFTDAAITRQALDKALRMAVKDSFNCITIDGCMSTNDSVMVLANGWADNAAIAAGRQFDAFLAALKCVCLELAKMIVEDAEGATKFICINVHKARTSSEAKRIALAVANSALFKTAVYAQSSNFLGRVVAAAGSAGAAVKEDDLVITISPLHKPRITLDISVGNGRGEATVYTSDLTHGYIKINAEYN
ncbi:MAG TPA: bifunctional glutamate N-acetyltransferase/amino-acid acetyltransferase ArgJ [Patescibacteria group bacterium]|nr:bifunctional glutamate N-acetyltransferase/amino-acid acetyltransferase ArgJ [Patescibacteria group bacterium]